MKFTEPTTEQERQLMKELSAAYGLLWNCIPYVCTAINEGRMNALDQMGFWDKLNAASYFVEIVSFDDEGHAELETEMALNLDNRADELAILASLNS